jgi:hypothetical protein
MICTEEHIQSYDRMLWDLCVQQGGLGIYPREKVEAIVTHEILGKCKYATVTRFASEFHRAYGVMHCPAQQHIEIKGKQSAVYRKYSGRQTKSRSGPVLATGGDLLLALEALARSGEQGPPAVPAGSVAAPSHQDAEASARDGAELMAPAAVGAAHLPPVSHLTAEERGIMDALMATLADE